MDLEDVLGSIGETFGGAEQVRRVLEIVDLIDDNRDGVMNAVGFIGDHGDELLGVIDFLKDHGDDLLDLLGRLPDILGRAGQALATAAGAAIDASAFLTAGDGLDADDVTSAAASAIKLCQEHLGSVAELLERVGDELSDISIPTLSVERSEVMGLSVVSGVDIGSTHPAAGAARTLQAGGQQISEVAAALADAGVGLQRLQTNLSAAGTKVESLAGDVGRSGEVLAELSGVTPKPTSKSEKRATPKKPAAKRSAKKKRTAKAPGTAKKKRTSAKRTSTKKKPAKKTAKKKQAKPTPVTGVVIT